MESRTSFTEILALGHALRDYLTKNGVQLSPDSRLARALESASIAVQCWRQQSTPKHLDVAQVIEDVSSVEALATIVLDSAGTEREEQLLVKLSALASGDPRFVVAGEQSEERDHVFELACWHVCTRFSDNVEFAEPDVTCTYRGHRWGLACKSVYGGSERAVKAIRKGWNQVLRSKVDRGLVVVHLTNCFPHPKMNEKAPDGDILAVRDVAQLERLFSTHLRSVSTPIEQRLLASLRRDPKQDRTRLAGVLYLAHSMPYFRGVRQRVGCAVYQQMTNDSADARDFVESFNEFWQDFGGTLESRTGSN